MNDEFRKIKVGITHGDINGIGCETILRLLADERVAQDICTPVVYGNGKAMNFYRRAIGLADDEASLEIVADASEAAEDCNNLVDVLGGAEPHITPGAPSEEAGKAAFEALERAVADLRAGKIDVLVTAPIDKKTIQSDLFHFPGHTEYLAASLGEPGRETPLMMLCDDRGLRVALVTMHVPVAKVAQEVTEELVVEKLRLLRRSLAEDFALPDARIAVLALNPHAGEEGLLGSEEKEVVEPAMERGRREGIQCFGPYAADGFFGSGDYRRFDAVLAMYHDQGLAPFKVIAMEHGVNVTAGLPYVRTSPDHGTAYDIAGKGTASEESLRQALYMAIDIYRNRQREAEATANPLPISPERPERPQRRPRPEK